MLSKNPSLEAGLLGAVPAEYINTGLVNNVPRATRAVGFTHYQKRPVGVLTSEWPVPTLFGDEQLFSGHRVLNHFPQPARSASRARSCDAGSSAPTSNQERYGLHTWRVGDRVAYTAGAANEAAAEAVVWRITSREAHGSEQARRTLILYEQSTETFFVGTWPSWRRIAQDDLEGDFDVDNDKHVKLISEAQWSDLAVRWESSVDLKSIDTITKLKRAAAEPPPSIKVAAKAAAAAKAAVAAAAAEAERRAAKAQARAERQRAALEKC